MVKKLSVLHGALDKTIYSHWYADPICFKPIGNANLYLQLAEDAKNRCYPEIDLFENESGYRIDQQWLHDLALHTQVIIKNSPICYIHGRILYSALSRYLKDNPAQTRSEHITVLETGTARGFSALCMAKSFHDMDRAGTIFTFDLIPHDRKIYWNCIDDCDFVKKTRQELLSPWSNLVKDHLLFMQGDTRLNLPKIYATRINFAFLDGSHTYEDVIFEFEQIKDRQIVGDVVVYDDYTINQFPGLVKAVDEICKQYGYRKKIISSHAERSYVVATKM